LIRASKAVETAEPLLLPKEWLEPETTFASTPPAGRGRLLVSCLLSLAIHASLFLLVRTWLVFPPPAEPGGSAAFSIALVEPSDEPSGFGGPSPVTQVAKPEPERAPVPPPVKPRPAPRIKPVVRAPKPPPIRQHAIDGVRIATAADIRKKLEQERNPEVVPPSPSSAEPSPVEPRPEPEKQVAPLPAPQGETTLLGAGRPNRDSAGTGPGGSADSGSGLGEIVTIIEPGTLRGLFRPDSPGYHGRIFGQISVRSSVSPDSLYGRIYLLPEQPLYRDYSQRNLFGFDFRQDLGEVAFREFETGRVNTPGAYLLVTDLFEDGHYSTMAHTVLFTFPRTPPGGGNLYDVVEEPGGDFRLRGPAGSSLVFDGRSGALLRTHRFVVEPPAEIGTPPRIAYRGLQLRLESVGSNPFLAGRPATVVDASGQQCELSTSDLFSYAGRQESDVFRFASDSAFFSFLRSRCSGLELPEPAVTRVAQTEKKPTKARRSKEGTGLFQLFSPRGR